MCKRNRQDQNRPKIFNDKVKNAVSLITKMHKRNSDNLDGIFALIPFGQHDEYQLKIRPYRHSIEKILFDHLKTMTDNEIHNAEILYDEFLELKGDNK